MGGPPRLRVWRLGTKGNRTGHGMPVPREPSPSHGCRPGHTRSPMDEGLGLGKALRAAQGCARSRLPPWGGSSEPTLQDVRLAVARAVPEGQGQTLCPSATWRPTLPTRAPSGPSHPGLGQRVAPAVPPTGRRWGDVGRLRQRGRAAGLGPSPLRTPRCPGAGCPCLFATSRACGLSLWRGVTVDPGTRLQTEAAMERRQNRPPQKGGVRVRHPSPRGSRVGTHTFRGSAPWLRGHRPRVAHATWHPTWRDGGVFGTWSPIPIRAPGSL